MVSPRTSTYTTLGLSIAAVALVVSVQAAPRTDQATRLIVDARQALGGDALLSSIHSFTIKGSITRHGSIARGPSGHGSFEIACDLPDKFVRRETTICPILLPAADDMGPACSPETTLLGINGDQIVYEPRWTFLRDATLQPLSPVKTSVRPLLLVQAQSDFIRVTLGLFAASFHGAPVQFADAPAAASRSAVIVSGDHIAGALFFDPLTHRPSSFGEYRYDDYRNVNGLMVPFRVARTNDYSSTASPVRPEPSHDVEVWQVREFRVNVAIDPKTFKPYVN